MRFWITKYALTKGVFAVDGQVSDISPTMITVPGTFTTCYHGEGREWHRTESAAKARVVEMVDAKLKALKRQKTKLEKLREQNST